MTHGHLYFMRVTHAGSSMISGEGELVDLTPTFYAGARPRTRVANPMPIKRHTTSSVDREIDRFYFCVNDSTK